MQTGVRPSSMRYSKGGRGVTERITKTTPTLPHGPLKMRVRSGSVLPT
jgi:hypothetical protein